jgi:hypothetical protein
MQPAVNSGENYSCEECGISQLPLWDFFECNTRHEPKDDRLKALGSQFPFWDFGECNPLTPANTSIAYSILSSQFPLWDFGECNLKAFGFTDAEIAYSLCGISVNATDAVSAVFRGIGGENQRVPPLTPLLQQPL